MRVLVVDQDSSLLERLARALRDSFPLDIVTTKADALDLLRQNDFDVLVAGERLADGSGLDLISQAERRFPSALRVFAVERSRLELLRGRLGPFKLFQTINYPIDTGELHSVLMLAQAASAGEADIEALDDDFGEFELGEESDETSFETVREPIRAFSGAAARSVPRSAPMVSVPVDPWSVDSRSPSTSEPGGTRTSGAATRPSEPFPRKSARDSFPSNLAVNSDLAEASRLAASMEAPLARMPEKRFLQPGRWMLAGALALIVGGGILLWALRDAGEQQAADSPSSTSSPSADSSQQIQALVRQIEEALTHDDFPKARQAAARLRSLAPEHPRLVFLESLIERGERAQALSLSDPAAPAPESAASQTPSPAATGDSTPQEGTLAASASSDESSSLAAGSSPSASASATAVATTEQRPAQTSTAAAAISKQRPTQASAKDTATGQRPVQTSTASAVTASEQRLAQTSAETARKLTASTEPTRTPAGRTAAERPGTRYRHIPAGSVDDVPIYGAPPGEPVLGPAVNASSQPRRQPGPAGQRLVGVDPIWLPSQAGDSATRTASASSLPDVQPARLVHHVEPEYPPAAFRQRIEGVVELAITIETDGSVTDVEVVSAEPPGIFEDAAMQAVRRWRYEPRKVDGTPTESRAHVRIDFEIGE